MNVTLPNGQVINDVPEGTTKAQLAEKLQRNGMDVPKEWLAPEQPAPEKQGFVSSLVTNMLAGGDLPPEKPAETVGGALEQGVKQFGYGVGRMSGLGTAVRAAGRAAGVPQVSTQPSTVPEYIGRGLGNVAGVGLDIAALPAMAVTEGANLLGKVPSLTDAASAVAQKMGLGGTIGAGVGGLGGYADTGTARGTATGMLTGGALGAGFGAVAGAIPVIGEIESRLNPFRQSGKEALAGVRLGSETGKLENANLNPNFQYAATETNPAARATLGVATQTPSGQQRLGNAVTQSLEDTQKTIGQTTPPEVVAKAANAPVKADIAKVEQAGKVSKEQAKAAQSAAETAKTKADEAAVRLGTESALPSEQGRALSVAARKKVDEIKAKRAEDVKPQLEDLNKVLEEKGADAVPAQGVAEELANVRAGGRPIGEMNISPEAEQKTTEQLADSGIAAPSLGQIRKGNTLSSHLFGEDNAGVTSYTQLKTVERELENAKAAAGKTGNQSDYNGYDTVLRSVREALNAHTEGKEQAFRDAYRNASGPLNDLMQGEGKLTPDAMELRKYEQGTTPADQAEYNARSSRLLKKAFTSPDAQTAQELKTLLGDESAQKMAGNYFAAQLRGKGASAVDDFIFKNRDFLSEFPENGPLRSSLEQLRSARQSVETTAEAAKSAKVSSAEAPRELTSKLFDEQPDVAHAQINDILDNAGKDTAANAKVKLRDLRERLTQTLGAKGAQTALVDSAKARMRSAISTALGKAKTEGEVTPMTFGEARGVVDRLSQTWDASRKSLVDGNVVTEGDAKNIDVVMKNLRLMKNALRPATESEPGSSLAAYGASGVDVLGTKLKFYLKPFKGTREEIDELVSKGMFDRGTMAKLSSRLEAAKTRAQKARVFQASPVLKSLMAANYASEAMQRPKTEDNQ